MKKFLLITLLGSILIVKSQAQVSVDSCRLHLSLLTCSPGQELYSSWGHTAIRVVDSAAGVDMVFNYGTFDDRDPLFLARFTKGLMIYSLSAYPFSEFVEEYRYYERGVIEQVLQLDCAIKMKLYQALQVNHTGDNRFYKYFFKSDNCTTRARDIVANTIGNDFKTGQVIPPESYTFRNLIHFYLDSSKQYWNKLGIDILLGANLDKKASNEEAMFLPDFLMKGFDSTTIAGQPLVTKTNIILPAPETKPASSVLTPIIVFSVLAFCLILMGFSRKESIKKFLVVFDRVFFLLLGILGILLLVLWIIRIDTVCRNNLNLLWALPSHFLIGFVSWKKKWAKTYFKFTLILTILVLLVFYLLPQQLNAAIIPLLLIIIARAWNRTKQVQDHKLV